MAIGREDVLNVAQLAQLSLAEDELEPMVRDLEKIIGYVKQLDELDTTGVAPTTQVAVSAAPLRSDETGEPMDREKILAEAPRHNDEGFAVPAFVDEG